MTKQQKEKIEQLRIDGYSYAKIAKRLDISENTIKSFCRRNNLGRACLDITAQADDSFCSQCGAQLIHTTGAKKKRFCSDKCRMKWWDAHPEAIKRKAIYTFTCDHCGIKFESYGNKKRKYCSRSCYGKSKAARI